MTTLILEVHNDAFCIIMDFPLRQQSEDASIFLKGNRVKHEWILLYQNRYPHLYGKRRMLPEGVDAELLAKVLSNPEMEALLTSLAKTMK